MPPMARARLSSGSAALGGGWDTPAKELCPRLAVRLQEDGIGSLRVRFRNPTDSEEAVHDVSTAWIISNKRESSASASMGADRVGKLNCNCAFF
jgi:hypothetical protein